MRIDGYVGDRADLAMRRRGSGFSGMAVRYLYRGEDSEHETENGNPDAAEF
jgi:hypothetical protein